MKKVEVERLVSKAIIITVIICCVMFGMWLIQQGYFSYETALAMRPITIAVSVVFAISAVVFIALGVRNNSSKFYIIASGSAALAILSMLLKINYEIKALEFVISGINIKFFPLVLMALLMAIVIYWAVTIVKIVRN